MNHCNYDSLSLPNENRSKESLSSTKTIKKDLKLLSEEEELIRKFEEKCKKSLSKQTSMFQVPPGVQNRMRRVNQLGFHNLLTTNFLMGIFSGLLITLFTILIFVPKKKTPHNDLSDSLSHLRNKYFKKSNTWSTDEIQEWLYQLGPWTSEFSNAVYNLNMGTCFILNLQDMNICSLLNFVIKYL